MTANMAVLLCPVLIYRYFIGNKLEFAKFSWGESAPIFMNIHSFPMFIYVILLVGTFALACESELMYVLFSWCCSACLMSLSTAITTLSCGTMPSIICRSQLSMSSWVAAGNGRTHSLGSTLQLRWTTQRSHLPVWFVISSQVELTSLSLPFTGICEYDGSWEISTQAERVDWYHSKQAELKEGKLPLILCSTLSFLNNFFLFQWLTVYELVNL